MDRLTRKELKTDKFAVEVGQTVEFLEEHRKQSFIIGGAIVALIVLIAGFYYYQGIRHAERQVALKEALRTFDAVVGEGSSPYLKSFATEQEKDAAVQKELNALIEEYPGSDEAMIATFYLGVDAMNKSDTTGAEAYFKKVAGSAGKEWASQAKLSLAQLYLGQDKTGEAEKLLRELVDNPTVLVSKEQATIALATAIAKTDPAKARELLEPLRTQSGAVSRVALTALSGIPEK